MSEWRARIDKRKRIKRRKEDLRPLTRAYVPQKTKRGRKVHMALVGGREMFCGLIGEGFEIAKQFRNVNCANCIRAQNKIVTMILVARRKREMKADADKRYMPPK